MEETTGVSVVEKTNEKAKLGPSCFWCGNSEHLTHTTDPYGAVSGDENLYYMCPDCILDRNAAV
jgi:hypothetical protein